MPKFIYTAKKSPTETVDGTVIADNQSAAIQKLSKDGLYILHIDEFIQAAERTGQAKNIFQKKVSLKDLSNFTRQLSDLLESGLPIVKALDIAHNQTDNKRFKHIIADVRDVCMEGNTLSVALSKHPGVFSTLFVSMVRSGESSGTLEGILERLADFNDKQLEVQTKVKSALAYPILMSGVGVLTIIVLFTFVMPRIIGMFSDLGQALPAPTQVLVNVHSFVLNFWWLIGLAVFGIYASVQGIYSTNDGRRSIDELKLKVPLFGDLIKKVEIARFTRTLGTLLNSGIPLLEALRIDMDTLNNKVIQDDIDKCITSVREGTELAKSLQSSKMFPAFTLNMISIGEESGRLEKSLLKVASTYERETDNAIKVMLSLIEPLMILVLGAVVGFIVIAMLLPIFEINFSAR